MRHQYFHWRHRTFHFISPLFVFKPQFSLEIPMENLGVSEVNKSRVPNKNLGGSNENLAVSKENLGVSNENLGVYNENLGVSHKILGVSHKILGVPNENLVASKENLWSLMNLLGSPTKSSGLHCKNIYFHFMGTFLNLRFKIFFKYLLTLKLNKLWLWRTEGQLSTLENSFWCAETLWKITDARSCTIFSYH